MAIEAVCPGVSVREGCQTNTRGLDIATGLPQGTTEVRHFLYSMIHIDRLDLFLLGNGADDLPIDRRIECLSNSTNQ